MISATRVPAGARATAPIANATDSLQLRYLSAIRGYQLNGVPGH
jgi:hypothetical protein